MQKNVLTIDQKRFEQLIHSMNVPIERKHYKHENVLWFLRIGAIQNATNKNFHAAVEVARKLV